MLGHSPKQTYTREEVRRLLAITERRLRSWEKQDLIRHAELFAFSDLIALRTLLKLCESRVPPVRIRKAVASLRQKLGGANPLTELKVFSDGRRISVQIDGRKMEPISGQLLLDFDQTELKKLLSFPDTGERRAQHERHLEAERWFQKGLDLEASGAAPEEVISAYQRAAELDPGSAGALVNLGTIHFNARMWAEAERHYKQALEADPNYALAHFNLGNLFDERGDRARAMHHYLAAIRLNPGYADAHYNLALVYQGSGQLMNAVRHWREYLKLDPGSSWAIIARRELDKLKRASIIPGTSADISGTSAEP